MSGNAEVPLVKFLGIPLNITLSNFTGKSDYSQRIHKRNFTYISKLILYN